MSSFKVLVCIFPVHLTYRGLCDPAHRHGDAQQGVALILRQSQQLRDVPESLRWGVPVQTGRGLPVRHNKHHKLLHFKLSDFVYICQQKVQNNHCDCLSLKCWVDSRREDVQQLLSVGDVRYCRLGAVEQTQEDAASVSSGAVDLLRCLLGQAAHRTLHPANRGGARNEDKKRCFYSI